MATLPACRFAEIEANRRPFTVEIRRHCTRYEAREERCGLVGDLRTAARHAESTKSHPP